ncbi:MAG: hypothetical protein JWM80_4630, partial [Cyanobacteria bacterium RYN_339]|nr:hypothetical protein [Cyanobacteria bacterium RYN_339]
PPVAPPPPPAPPVAPLPPPPSFSVPTPQPTTPPSINVPAPQPTPSVSLPPTSTPAVTPPRSSIPLPGYLPAPNTTLPTTPRPNTTLPTAPRPNTSLPTTTRPCPPLPTAPRPNPGLPTAPPPRTSFPTAPKPQPAPPRTSFPPAPKPQPALPPRVSLPPAKPQPTWAVFGDPVIKELGGETETLNNTGGRYVVMESKDGSYLVEHEVIEEQGSAAGRRDHRNGAYTQTVAIRQDGNVIVYRNQQNATTLGAKVNQLEINGQLVAVPVNGSLKLPHGGEIRRTAPDRVSKDGVFTILSAQGDKLEIKDRGNHIDLYGTPAASRKPGELAGMAGALDQRGPGFYQRTGTPGQPGWQDLKKLPGGQLRGSQADTAFVQSWRAEGRENLL